MRLIDKYYDKLYKQTLKVTKKLFGRDITESLVLRNSLKNEIQDSLKKPMSEITYDEIAKNKLCYQYAKYKTLSKILEVLEEACLLKTFIIEEFEDECC